MKKYEINGTEKTFPDTAPSCRVCKDGEIYKERTYKTNTEYPNIREHICLECESKYKEERIIPELPIDMDITKEIYESQVKEFIVENNFLTQENAPLFILKISEDYKSLLKISPKIVELRLIYEKTKICPEHLWIESKPFKTLEGTFSIKNCAVCKISSMNHNGKRTYDTLVVLVNFLITQSNIYDIKIRERGEMFTNMIIEGLDIKPTEITDTNNTAKELGLTKTHIKPKLNFEVKENEI